MKKVIEAKAEKVKIIANDIAKAKSIMLFDFSTLDAKTSTSLRRKLHDANAKMYVAKNSIISRALKEKNIEFDAISNSTALVLAFGDEIVSFKELNEVIKNKPTVKFKWGILEGKKIIATEFASIANLPGRNDLYSMFLSCLQAPMRNLAYGLKAIADAKNGNIATPVEEVAAA